MPKDLSHLDALNTRLRHEKEAIARSKSEDEIKLRKVWIDQIESEIADEYKFLGIDPSVSFEGSDEDLLNELNASNSKEYKMPNKIATTSEEAALEHWIMERLTLLSSDQLHRIKAIIAANPPLGFGDKGEFGKYEDDQVDPPLPFSRNDGGNASFSSNKIQIKKYASGYFNTPRLPGQMFKSQAELLKAVKLALSTSSS